VPVPTGLGGRGGVARAATDGPRDSCRRGPGDNDRGVSTRWFDEVGVPAPATPSPMWAENRLLPRSERDMGKRPGQRLWPKGVGGQSVSKRFPQVRPGPQILC
jgi:hypothetical protein